MLNIDEAHARFKSIVAEVPAEDDRPICDNESATRLRLIDPILIEVLGWPRGFIHPEVKAGEGRLDYLLKDPKGICWFVVEAKKRNVELVSPDSKTTELKFKISGTVFQKNCWPIIETQMPEYLGRYLPCYGIVTNGEQWVGFLANLKPQEVDLSETQAVVFRSLKHINDNFERFFNCFSYATIGHRALRSFLAPDAAQGVVHCAEPDRVVSIDEERPLNYQEADDFHPNLRRAMDAAFSPIQNDPEALTRCFVESQESHEAESRLERLATELGTSLTCASKYPGEVTAEVDSHAAESVVDIKKMEGRGYLARLVGEQSSGKSVFLERFYESKLGTLRNNISLVWVDCEAFEPFSGDEASKVALAALKEELFGDDGPTWEHLKAVYSREWHSRIRLLGIGQEGSPELRQAFVQEVQQLEIKSPLAALKRYSDFSVANRRRLPCIVLDNVDHLKSAAEAVAWAVAIHKSTFALTTVAIEDTTLWRLREAGDDQLAKHSPEQFWLYRPRVHQVLENRCKYLKDVLSSTESSGARAKTHIGKHRQIQWTVDVEGLVKVVSLILLTEKQITSWIGQICNYNIHEVLQLCKQIVLSPHVKAKDLLTSQVTGKPFHPRNVLKAIISPKNEQYQGGPTDLVVNIFGTWVDHDWAPLLPARILAYLKERESEDRNRKEKFPGFVPIQKIQSLFQSSLGVPEGITKVSIEKLVGSKLIELYNPGHQGFGIVDTAKVKITHRGRLHLEWAIEEPTYVRMMAEVDPLVDRDTFLELRSGREAFLNLIRSGATSSVIRVEETKIVANYVSYLLTAGDRVAPVLEIDAEMNAVRSFEKALEHKWLGSTPMKQLPLGISKRTENGAPSA
jgi:hypothetical protein